MLIFLYLEGKSGIATTIRDSRIKKVTSDGGSEINGNRAMPPIKEIISSRMKSFLRNSTILFLIV
ncbi:hypothetical protein ACFL2A_05415 [Thermodesulfobacteriota bacterium]